MCLLAGLPSGSLSGSAKPDLDSKLADHQPAALGLHRDGRVFRSSCAHPTDLFLGAGNQLERGASRPPASSDCIDAHIAHTERETTSEGTPGQIARTQLEDAQHTETHSTFRYNLTLPAAAQVLFEAGGVIPLSLVSFAYGVSWNETPFSPLDLFGWLLFAFGTWLNLYPEYTRYR